MIELVVERNPGETRIAVRDDGRTVEVHFDRLGATSRIGAIHLARATRVEPGVGAFLDIGGHDPAFLPEGGRKVVEGSAFPVQVTKDGLVGKGPEVTRLVVLDGGALALTPSQPGIALSRKLAESARKRLRARLRAILGGDEPQPGVLVRSSVREADDLEAICRDLQVEWHAIEARLGEPPPLLLRGPPDPMLFLVRRVRPARVIAGDAATAARLRGLSPVAVEKIDRPFEALGVEDEIARALGREIPIQGGHLIVDEAEALTAIDVNGTGDRLPLCLAAAAEVARIVRLRDIGGMIVVDFPFGDGREFREKIGAALGRAVLGDPRPVDCLGWTRGGLYELTRSRSGSSLAQRLLEPSAARLSVETAGLAALRAIARANGGRLRLAASPEVIDWLGGAGAAALAEAMRAVALVAEPSYGRERFDVTAE